MAARRRSAQQLHSRSSGFRFGLKFTIYLLGIGYGIAFTLSSALGVQLFGILLLGSMFAHGVELQHQVLHNQGFRNARLNEWTGMLLGLPMLVSHAGYQASHMRHHQLIGTPDNTDFFDYGGDADAKGLAHVAVWARRLLMPAHYVGFARQAWRALLGLPVEGDSQAVSRRIRRDHRFMLAALALALLVSVAWQTTAFLFAWFVPLLLVATPLHALIELPEHFGCDHATTDITRNTRTLRSNAFMTWFTNGNNFHVEHHLRPGFPIDKLHRLHADGAERLHHFHPGYISFYRAMLQGRIGTATRKDS